MSLAAVLIPADRAEDFRSSLATNPETLPQGADRKIVLCRFSREADYSTGVSHGLTLAEWSPDTKNQPSDLASLMLMGAYEVGKIFFELAAADPDGVSTLQLRLESFTDELRRQARFEEQLQGMFIAEPIEDGVTHPAQNLIEKALEEDEPLVSEWIRAFVDTQRPSFAAAALKCAGRLLSPGSEQWRMSLVEQALKHEDPEVRDAAVQALESWGGERAVEILKKHHEPRPWLRDYIDRVIRDLSRGR